MFHRVLIILLASILLSGCVTTQRRLEGSPKAIGRELREIPPLKTGEWIRATTLEGRIYEFSFVRQTEDALEGGDATVPLNQLKKMEIYRIRMPAPIYLLGDVAFEAEVKNTLQYRGQRRFKFTDGTAVRDSFDEVTLSDDDQLEWSAQTVSPVSSLGGYKESRVVSRSLSSLGQMSTRYRTLYRWDGTDAHRLKLIKKTGVLRPGNWVKIQRRNGELAEFQFRSLEGDTLVGGDDSVALSQIAEMKVYSPNQVARGAAAAALVPLIIIAPFAMPASGGMPPMAP